MDRGDWYDIVVFLHIGFVVLGLGPSMALAVIGPRIPKAPIPARLPLTEAVQAISSRLVEPAAGLIFLSGVGAVFLSDDVWTFSQSWLVIGVVLWAIATAIGLGVLRPATNRMIAIQRSLTGPPSQDQMGTLESLGKRQAIFNGINHLLLVMLIFDMVWKPGIPR